MYFILSENKKRNYYYYYYYSCHVTAWSRWHMTCWVGSSHSSHHFNYFLDFSRWALELRKLNIFENELCIKKTRFFNIDIWDKWKCISLSFYFTTWSMHLCTVHIWYSKNQNSKKIKCSWKEWMSRERALSFDQWPIFSKNYKPIRVWL